MLVWPETATKSMVLICEHSSTIPAPLRTVCQPGHQGISQSYEIDNTRKTWGLGEGIFDSPGMRHDGDSELGTEQQHAQDLIDAAEPQCVKLDGVCGLCLEQLFEHDAVVDMFSRGDADAIRFQSLADLGMAQYVVRRGWLLDEPVDAAR